MSLRKRPHQSFMKQKGKSQVSTTLRSNSKKTMLTCRSGIRYARSETISSNGYVEWDNVHHFKCGLIVTAKY